MATVSAYFPDGSPLLAEITRRADAEHDGKTAAYARAAIERDLGARADSPPSPIAPDVMESLTRILCGHSKGLRMRAALAGVDQVQHLTDLLETHLAELEAHAADAKDSVGSMIRAAAAGSPPVAPARAPTPPEIVKPSRPKRGS